MKIELSNWSDRSVGGFKSWPAAPGQRRVFSENGRYYSCLNFSFQCSMVPTDRASLTLHIFKTVRIQLMA